MPKLAIDSLSTAQIQQIAASLFKDRVVDSSEDLQAPNMPAARRSRVPLGLQGLLPRGKV